MEKGEIVGQYEIVAMVGRGGMATVYKAHHARLNRLVALKIIQPNFVRDPQFLVRFEREAQIIARLEHPHIVPLYDYAEHHGQPYLVMKYIEGETLKERITHKRLPFLEALRVLSEIASALDYAHTQNVLHRDVKPNNIMLDKRGDAYLMDFGLARAGEETSMSVEITLGTPDYISPEQGRGDKNLTPATDIYSLAVVAYELLVGDVPFKGETHMALIHQHLYAPVPLPSELGRPLPLEVEQTLLRALSKEPQDRHPTAQLLVQALEAGYGLRTMPDLPPPASKARSSVIKPLSDSKPKRTSEEIWRVTNEVQSVQAKRASDEQKRMDARRALGEVPAIDPALSTSPTSPMPALRVSSEATRIVSNEPSQPFVGMTTETQEVSVEHLINPKSRRKSTPPPAMPKPTLSYATSRAVTESRRDARSSFWRGTLFWVVLNASTFALLSAWRQNYSALMWQFPYELLPLSLSFVWGLRAGLHWWRNSEAQVRRLEATAQSLLQGQYGADWQSRFGFNALDSVFGLLSQRQALWHSLISQVVLYAILSLLAWLLAGFFGEIVPYIRWLPWGVMLVLGVVLALEGIALVRKPPIQRQLTSVLERENRLRA